MDLSQITEVASSDLESDINPMLQAGWVLLGVATGEDDERKPYIRYSVGFPGRPAQE